ncbi:MAG: T9SS type A sorting domain-containing protein [Bacteroidales bacterium]|nr:T9SS type A sorting domain-containing protein [Bacteroidales bacterium]
MKRKTKFKSFLLALAVLLSGLSNSVFGQAPDVIYHDGNDYFDSLQCANENSRITAGQWDNPYYITCAHDLMYLARRVNNPGCVITHSSGTNVNVSYDRYFKIHDSVTYIDLKDSIWIPIGEQLLMYHHGEGVFAGHFDGNNKKIYNMTITEQSLRDYWEDDDGNSYGQTYYGILGFFGSTDDCGIGEITMEIKNVILANASLELHTHYNKPYGGENSMEFGLLIGMNAVGDCEITNCRVEGKINFTGISEYKTIYGIGGMIGDMYAGEGITIVENCFSNVKMNLDLTDADTTNIQGIGGFAGGFSNGYVQNFINCAARVDMTVTGSNITAPIAGFVGTSFSSIDFTNCYALGTIKINGAIDGISGFSNLDEGEFNFSNCYTATVVDLSATPADGTNYAYWGIKSSGVGTTCENCHYLESWTKLNGVDNNWWIVDSNSNVVCEMEGHTATYMYSDEFVDTLNRLVIDPINETDTIFTTGAFHGDGYGFLRNYHFPVLDLEPIVDPQVIKAGMVVELPANYDNNMTNPDLHPQLGIIIEDGGQFRNWSSNAYEVTVERKLGYEVWEDLGNPIPAANDYRFLSNDSTYLDSVGIFSYWHTPHNYIVSYPYDYTTNDWAVDFAYRTDTWNQGNMSFVWNGGLDNGFDPAGTFYEDGSSPTPIGEAGETTVKFFGVQEARNWFFDPTVTNSGATNTNNGGTKWFALANPYTAAIHTNSFPNIDLTLIEAHSLQGDAVYIWDKSLNAWDMRTATVENDDTLIYPTHGFMVAPADNSATFQTMWSKFLFNYPISDDPYTGQVQQKSSEVLPMKITATANNYQKFARLTIGDNYDNKFDHYDAYVFLGDNQLIVEPYFVVADKNIVFNAIKDLPYVVPMNLHSDNPNANVDLTFTHIPDNVIAKLMDLENGTITEMENGDVYNTYTLEGENNGRFVVMLQAKANALSDVTAENSLNLWTYNNRLTIDGKDLQNVEVYNTLGQVVYSAKISGNQYSATLDLSSGSYIAKATSKTGTKTIKFVINK